MCGFVGFTGLREQREAILHRMADRIIHRGPDMEGYHISGDDPRTAIALGFRRLSIIDLAAGKQPMYNEDGTVVCVFNGEIYNFMDLRTELQAKGHIFKTHCDTEVIIHGYEEYGTALAARLRGMFAFVVWDTKTNEMYGARDIFGIKPFYYTQTDAGELLFGSEIKSLLEHPGFRREVNAEALRPYLGGREVLDHLVQHEATFAGRELHRHITVLVRTATQLLLVHIDEGEGTREEALATTEIVALRAIDSVVLTRSLTDPGTQARGAKRAAGSTAQGEAAGRGPAL